MVRGASALWTFLHTNWPSPCWYLLGQALYQTGMEETDRYLKGIRRSDEPSDFFLHEPGKMALQYAMHTLVLHAVLLPPTPERGLVDTQNIGRFLKRLRRGKNAPDMLLLDLLQAHHVSDGGCRPRPGEGSGKVLHSDPVHPAQDGPPLDDVPQFSEVSWPGVTLQRLHGHIRETDEAPVVSPAVENEQLHRERFKVLWTVAQWRNLDLDDVQAVEKIFPEPSVLYLLLQYPVPI